MSDMIERVAKAIYAASNDITQYDSEVAARAAIEAMREPTKEMFDAACTVDRYADPGDEWEPMIDAALGKVDA